MCVCFCGWMEEHGIASFLIDVCFSTDFIWSTVVDHGIASPSCDVCFSTDFGRTRYSIFLSCDRCLCQYRTYFFCSTSLLVLLITLCTPPCLPSFRLDPTYV